MMLSFLFSNSIHSTHIWAKRLGNKHRAVGLLVVFDDGEPGAAHCETAAVDCVDKFGFSFCAWCSRRAVADVGAARLKGVEVGTGRDFAIKILAGEPNFEIVSLGRGEAGVAGR